MSSILMRLKKVEEEHARECEAELRRPTEEPAVGGAWLLCDGIASKKKGTDDLEFQKMVYKKTKISCLVWAKYQYFYKGVWSDHCQIPFILSHCVEYLGLSCFHPSAGHATHRECLPPSRVVAPS